MMNATRSAILTYAESRDSFRLSDLLSYLNKSLEISKVSLSWYLREMVKDKSLYKLGRGIYTKESQNEVSFVPHLRNHGVEIAKSITKEFPYISVSVLDGQSFALFQHHVSANNAIYIEVDRDAMESVFHYLKREGYMVYLKPSKDFIYDNVDLSRDVVIVKPLVTESPLKEYEGVKTPTLEKILVDILCDDDLDYLHGSEWTYIMENAMSLYSISRTTMLRYASRRNAEEHIKQFFLNHHD